MLQLSQTSSKEEDSRKLILLKKSSQQLSKQLSAVGSFGGSSMTLDDDNDLDIELQVPTVDKRVHR